MEEEVRIATDRRSEVCVVSERETEVSYRLFSIDSLCHLREEETRESIEIVLGFRVFEERADMVWLDVSG
jgi:hypothetical protein